MHAGGNVRAGCVSMCVCVGCMDVYALLGVLIIYFDNHYATISTFILAKPTKVTGNIFLWLRSLSINLVLISLMNIFYICFYLFMLYAFHCVLAFSVFSRFIVSLYS